VGGILQNEGAIHRSHKKGVITLKKEELGLFLLGKSSELKSALFVQSLCVSALKGRGGMELFWRKTGHWPK